jgi:RNA polymerase sigma-70 factor (ECF subfamily)
MSQTGSPQTRPPENAEAVPSDRSLLHRFRAGNEDAATQLYLRYVRRVRALAQARCSPELARCADLEDLVQSVFGSFFRAARQGHYDLPAGEELWRIFLVIALNKIRARAVYHQAAKRDQRRCAGNDRFAWALANLPDEQAAQTSLQLAIDEALEGLPPEQRLLVQMRLEGYEVGEMAQRLGRSNRTVERLLQQARKTLGTLLLDSDTNTGGTKT